MTLVVGRYKTTTKSLSTDQRLSNICSCDRAEQFKRIEMYFAVILICIATAVTSAPRSAPTNQYTINVDGPEGRHVQMGEPGKSVSGYYTSRSLDGLMEYKTMYEADENGFRATGDHLPGVIPAVRSLNAPEGYVFKYESPGSHSHYMMGEPGKSVQGSFTYTDAEGRSQRVDYEADEKGYRVKPTKEEVKPIEIASQNDATVIIAAPAVPVVVAEPIPEIPVKIAPLVKVEAEPAPVSVAVAAVAESESRTAEEPPAPMMYYPKEAQVVIAAEPESRTVEQVQPAMMNYPMDPVAVDEPATRTIPEEQPAPMMYYPKEAEVAAPESRIIAEDPPSASMMSYPKDVAVAEAASRTITEEEKPVYMSYFIPAEVAKAAEPESRIVMTYPAGVDKEAAPESRTIEQVQPAMMNYPMDPVAVDEPATRTIPEEQPAAMMYYPKEAQVVIAAEPESRTVEQVQPAAMMYSKEAEVAAPESRTIPEQPPVPMMYYPKDPTSVVEPLGRTTAEVAVVASSDPAPVQPFIVTESKADKKAFYTVPVGFAGTHYYRIMPTFHYAAAPYPYAYGYPLLTRGSYVYVH